MRLLFTLAIADLRQGKLQLLCNIAMIVGVVLPLLVILGVRNGISAHLLEDLSRNSDILRLETQGNDAITEAQLQQILTWPEVRFAVLKTRSQSDFLRVRKAGGRQIEDALAMTTAAGDPLLGGNPAPVPGEVAVSRLLADRLLLDIGDMIDIVTDAPERTRQLALTGRVVAIAPARHLAGRSIMGPVAIMDRIEAFYEGYAMPEHGIVDGLDIAGRQTQFEGMRVHAADLASVPPLADRLSTTLNRIIRSEARQIEITLRLLQNAGQAFGLIATVALGGLSAALAFSFWAQITGKRRVLATLSLLGIPTRRLALFPVFQALVTMATALVVALALYVVAARIAEMLFSDLSGGRVTALGAGDLAVTILGGILLALITVALAARSVFRIDTATLLRETT